MAKQVIGLGNIADDGRGDTLRTAGDKINSNFTEVYNDISSTNTTVSNLSTTVNAINVPTDLSAFTDTTNVVPSDLSDLTDTTGLLFDGTYASLTGTPTIPNLSAVDGHILPDTNVTYDLGSSTNRFRHLYLSGNSVYFPTATLSENAKGGLTLPTNSVIPGVREFAYYPMSVAKFTESDPYNDYVEGSGGSQPAPDNAVAIDQLTYVMATNENITNPGATSFADFTPSVYGATISNGVVAQIFVDTANDYPDYQDGDSINSDNMILLDPGTNINNPQDILNSSISYALNAYVTSGSRAVATPSFDTTTLSSFKLNVLSSEPTAAEGLVALSDGSWGAGEGVNIYYNAQWNLMWAA